MRVFPIWLLICISFGLSAQNKHKMRIDSFKRELPLLEEATLKVNHLNTIALDYLSVDLDSVELYLNPALELAQKSNYPGGVAWNEYIRGQYLLNKGSLEVAREHLNNSVNIYNETKPEGYLGNLSKSYYYLGVVENMFSNYDKALYYYEESLEKTIDAGSEGVKENILTASLAQIYSMIKYYSKSEEYFDKTIKLAKEKKDTNVLGTTHYYISYNFYQQQKLDLAAMHMDSAFHYWEARGNTRSLAAASYQKGLIEMMLENYDLSEDYLQKSVEECIKIGDARNEFLSRVSLARTQYLKNPTDRENLLNLKSKFLGYINEAEEINSNTFLLDCKKHISEVLYSLGEYKLAYEMKHDFLVMEDTIKGIKVQEEIAALQEKYYSTISENKIASLNADNDLVAMKLKNSRTQTSILGIGFLLISGLLFVLWSTFKKVKSQNQIISQRNEEKDTLLREIHHRVKNNLQVISSLLLLQSKYIQDDTALDALQQGQDRVKSMALIHQDLYQADNLKGVNAKDYFIKLVNNLFESYNISENKIKLEMEVDPIMLDVDTMIPIGLIMNELVSNALKHAFSKEAEGLIKVSLKQQEGNLILSVSDNGKGLNDLTDLDGKSFGYELIKAFARKLKAKMKIEHLDGMNIKMSISNYSIAA